MCPYSGLRHNGSGTEANLARRAILLLKGHSPTFCKDVASEGRLPCAVILDCGITEAERKQIFHGELFCFPGPFAVIHGEPQSPGGPCPGPGTTTGPRAVTGTRTPNARRGRSCPQSALAMIFSSGALEGLRVHPWVFASMFSDFACITEP